MSAIQRTRSQIPILALGLGVSIVLNNGGMHNGSRRRVGIHQQRSVSASAYTTGVPVLRVRVDTPTAERER